MTTHTTEPFAAAVSAAADWRTALQQATTATWKAAGLSPFAAPYCVSHIERNGTYEGDLHYTDAAAVLTIATEYDGLVSREAVEDATCVSTRISVDGVTVRVWAYSYDAATPAGGETA